MSEISAPNPSLGETSERLLEPYCWGLDPLYWGHAKIFAFQIDKLVCAQGFKNAHFLKVGLGPYRPIQMVEVTGVIVRIKSFGKVSKYTIDDGTGFAHCLCFWNEYQAMEEHRAMYHLGDTVAIIGKVCVQQENYRSRDVLVKNFPPEVCVREIKIENMRKLSSDPNEELFAWTEILKLNKTDYCKQSTGVERFSVPPPKSEKGDGND
jgi:hypothetical protein